MNLVRREQADEGAVARLIVDNPKGNIFSADVMNELITEVREEKGTRATRLITLEGAGKNFSFGASVEEHTKDRVDEMLPVLRDLVMTIASSEVPVAAIVQGYCLGGAFEAVLACHLTFAAPDARMGVPEIRLGVFPPVAAALLPAKVGQAVSDRMILTGEELTGEELHTLGLVHRCFPAESLTSDTLDWALNTFGKFSAASLRHAARNARAVFLAELNEQMLDRERDYLDRLMATHDANEGIAAFIEKRTPVWRGI